MKHLIIINPKAGVKDNSNKIIEEIKKVFENEEYTYYLTKGKKDATVYVKEYLKNNFVFELKQKNPIPQRAIGYCYSKNLHLTPTMKEFMSFLNSSSI